MEVKKETQQQKALRVIPCYDDLIAFLKSWFAKTAPVFEKPILVVKRYSGNKSSWQEVAKWEVTDTARGELKEISLVCDNYTPLAVRVEIGATRVDFVLQTALTLPYNDLKLLSSIPVVISCKSDGATAIVFDASIIGKEIFKV